MQEANCVLGILEDESNNCHNNALVQSSIAMYKKMRLMRSYECAADIGTSVECIGISANKINNYRHIIIFLSFALGKL